MLLVLVQAALCQYPKLVFVQEVYRHGARFPIYDAPNTRGFKRDFGELTAVGMRQHYILGKALRTRYVGSLLSSTYNHSEVYVRSSDVHRTLMSAESQLLGMFEGSGPTLSPKVVDLAVPPYDKSQLLPTVQNDSAIPNRIQPVRVETARPGAKGRYNEDFLRSYSFENCPNEAKWEAANMRSEEYARISQEPRVQAYFERLWACSNSTAEKSLSQATMLIDNELSLQFMGGGCPLVKEDPQTTNYLVMSGVILDLYYTADQLRATFSPFARRTLDNFRDSQAGGYRFVMYSAHDTTMAMLLVSLKLTNFSCVNQTYHGSPVHDCVTEYPSFASNMLFEFWNSSANATFVRILYNGKSVGQPYCGGLQDCPFAQFSAHLESLYDPNYGALCGVPSGDSTSWPVFLLEGVLVFALLGALVKLHFSVKLLRERKV